MEPWKRRWQVDAVLAGLLPSLKLPTRIGMKECWWRTAGAITAGIGNIAMPGRLAVGLAIAGSGPHQ
jgi:hypothetical protein